MRSKSNVPKVKVLLHDLKYIDKVESKRTIYYVFQAENDYLIFSYRDSTYSSGNFNVVMADTVERIRRIFPGKKRVTRRMIEEHPRLRRFAKYFDVLESLYVLVALKQASIDGRSPKAKKLYFNIKGN